MQELYSVRGLFIKHTRQNITRTMLDRPFWNVTSRTVITPLMPKHHVRP